MEVLLQRHQKCNCWKCLKFREEKQQFEKGSSLSVGKGSEKRFLDLPS